MIADIRARMARVGLDVRIGLADTRGAAWALARFDPGIAAEGEGGARLAPLPVAALRLTPDVCAGLGRMGIATIAQLAAPPRRTVARRFGDAPLMRLDQALGRQAEPVSPAPAPLHFAARLTLPEPIGLTHVPPSAVHKYGRGTISGSCRREAKMVWKVGLEFTVRRMYEYCIMGT